MDPSSSEDFSCLSTTLVSSCCLTDDDEEEAEEEAIILLLLFLFALAEVERLLNPESDKSSGWVG